jgi:hypothetical protein
MVAYIVIKAPIHSDIPEVDSDESEDKDQDKSGLSETYR